MDSSYPAGRVQPDAGGEQPELGWFAHHEYGERRWNAYVLFSAGAGIDAVAEKLDTKRQVLQNWRAQWRKWWGNGCIPDFPYKPQVTLEEARTLLAVPDQPEPEAFITEEGRLLSEAGLKGVTYFVEWLEAQSHETRTTWRPEQAVRIAKAGSDLLKAATDIEDRPLRSRASAGTSVTNTLIVNNEGVTDNVADQLSLALDAWRVQSSFTGQ